MRLDLRYLGQSGLERKGDGLALHFSPNLARPATFFDGEVKDPIRFREAISSLHDVVVSDLRREKKDRSAFRTYKADEVGRERELRERIAREASTAELANGKKVPPPNLDQDFRRMHATYWRARHRWAAELMRDDPELFRHLVPCDPVVTVAPDVVFFECFSKDQSSYACLNVDRDAFAGTGDAALGTTNVDYSMALYDHFQELRTYRPTRLLVDPAGFSVDVHQKALVREEKIDLPPAWLRGFGQLQAAMALPARRIELSVDVLYSILVVLARKKDAKGGRALVFHLTPGERPVVEIEPWGIRLESRGPVYDAEVPLVAPPPGADPYRSAPARARVHTDLVKVWGRRRLFSLARLLPLITKLEVRLLGTGLPSVFVAHCGEMRLVLALSGWTANDWAGGANLDLLAGDFRDDAAVTAKVVTALGRDKSATLAELLHATGAQQRVVLGSLFGLAKQGQVVFDYATERYRWRPVLPVPLADAVLGPESPESTEGKRMARDKAVKVVSRSVLSAGKIHVAARVQDTACEAIFTEAGISRAKCTCSFFHRFGLRGGPCRHLLALRLTLAPEIELEASGPAAEIAAAPAELPANADVFTLRKDVADDVEATATKERRDAAALLEEAWDLAAPRLIAATSWSAALALAPGAADVLANGFVKPPLASRATGLHRDLLAEIGKVATRLGASPSATLNLAWMIHRPKKGKEAR